MPMSKARIIAYFAALPAGALKLREEPQGDATMAPAAAAEGGAPAEPAAPTDPCGMCHHGKMQKRMEKEEKAKEEYDMKCDQLSAEIDHVHMHLRELEHHAHEMMMEAEQDPDFDENDPQVKQMKAEMEAEFEHLHQMMQELPMKYMEFEEEKHKKIDEAWKIEEGECEADCQPEEQEAAEVDTCAGDPQCADAVLDHHEPCKNGMTHWEGKCEPWHKGEGREQHEQMKKDCAEMTDPEGNPAPGTWMPDEQTGGWCEPPPPPAAGATVPAPPAGEQGPEAPPAGATVPPAGGEQGPAAPAAGDAPAAGGDPTQGPEAPPAGAPVPPAGEQGPPAGENGETSAIPPAGAPAQGAN